MRSIGWLALGLLLVASTVVATTSVPPFSDPLTIQIDSGLVSGTWVDVPDRPDFSSSSASPHAHQKKQVVLTEDDEFRSPSSAAHADSTSDQPNSSRVAVWRSIPFASPPVGALRWMPPAPVANWSGVYNATNFRAFCVQPDGSGEEDCLQLNVYVPERVLMKHRAGKLTKGVSVFFYIHGGGLTGGSGIFEVLAPFTAHAGEDDEGVISVSINYRLNIFGFLAIKEMAAAQQEVTANFGLLDQQFALQWVQRNIALFGGDPTRVTLGGQSSGGTSIFGLMSSKNSIGLFRGGIALSGSINTSMTIEQGYAQNTAVVPSLNCTNSDPTQVMSCLRSQNITALTNAIPDCWNTPEMWGLENLTPQGRNFCGFIFIDGVTVHAGFQEALEMGLVDAGLIIGNMGQESDLGPDVDVYNYSDAQWQALLTQSLVGMGDPTMSNVIWGLYANDTAVNPAKAYNSFNTDYGLTCGTVQLGMGAKLGAFSSPFYLFVNQWAPSTPVPLGTRSAHFAYHTWDWSAACENWPLLWSPTPQDWALSKLLQGIWYSFIKTGEIDPQYGWGSIETAPNFPNHYSSYVFSNFTATPSGVYNDYKAGTCVVLAEYGFNQNFEWCD